MNEAATVDPVQYDLLPQRRLGVIRMPDMVKQICDATGISPDYVGEIHIYPSRLEIRRQLVNEDGHRYVIKKKGHPRYGQLAEEVVIFDMVRGPAA